MPSEAALAVERQEVARERVHGAELQGRREVRGALGQQPGPRAAEHLPPRTCGAHVLRITSCRLCDPPAHDSRRTLPRTAADTFHRPENTRSTSVNSGETTSTLPKATCGL